jgi:hypothetical protein
VNLFLSSLLRTFKTYGTSFGVALAVGGYLSMFIAISDVHAQSQNQTQSNRAKVVVQSGAKQPGIKAPRTQSQSLTPKKSSLVDTSKEGGLAPDVNSSLDFRVQRGCIKTDSLDGNLPAQLGINDPVFFEFFQNPDVHPIGLWWILNPRGSPAVPVSQFSGSGAIPIGRLV